VVTDRIATFTENGVLLESGRELEADIIITATGLQVQAMGAVSLSVDGRPVSLPDTIAYKGMMLSGVPNFAYAIGYTNASWTLKIGLLCEHFCRLLAYMDAHGYDTARPEPADRAMPTRPFLNFGAGYIRRAIDQLPRQGNRAPWLTSMSYVRDVKLLRRLPVQDPELRFSRRQDSSGQHPGGIRTRIAENARVAATATAATAAAAAEEAAGKASFARLLTYPPERAAGQIVAAVENRRPRLLIALSARIPDVIARIAPARYPALLKTAQRLQSRSR